MDTTIWTIVRMRMVWENGQHLSLTTFWYRHLPICLSSQYVHFAHRCYIPGIAINAVDNYVHMFSQTHSPLFPSKTTANRLIAWVHTNTPTDAYYDAVYTVKPVIGCPRSVVLLHGIRQHRVLISAPQCRSVRLVPKECSCSLSAHSSGSSQGSCTNLYLHNCTENIENNVETAGLRVDLNLRGATK